LACPNYDFVFGLHLIHVTYGVVVGQEHMGAAFPHFSDVRTRWKRVPTLFHSKLTWSYVRFLRCPVCSFSAGFRWWGPGARRGGRPHVRMQNL